MLSNLFGSNARVKILKLFLLHPDKKYYIRQLARDLGLQVNSARRELENLEKFGLLKSTIGKEDDSPQVISNQDDLKDLMAGKIVTTKEPVEMEDKKTKKTSDKQDKKYYQTNKDFILFEEIKNLIVKAQVLYEKDFVDKIKKTGNVKLLILTGIFVGKDSSIDMLLVGRVNRDKFSNLVTSLEKEIDKVIKFTIMDPDDFKYRKDMTDIFLYDILEGQNVIVIDEYGLK